MSAYRYSLGKFIKDWMLIISMVSGVAAYLIYRSIPALHPAGPVLLSLCKSIQPMLLFAMLFLSFCKIEPRQMRLHRWMGWLLLLQGGLFTALAFLIASFPGIQLRYALEAFMLCIICPTATACAVVTGKLGGNMAGVVTYTVLINLLVSVMVPLTVPLIHPIEGMSFWKSFLLIISKVFPLLILPCLAAWAVRYLLPGIHAWFLRYSSASFSIWAVSLGLAILMSTRAIVHSGGSMWLLLEIAGGSLLACILQFASGRMIGARYGCPISAGQALGQKNTVFGIWLGYTFLNPVISIAGGFYSIWHNVFNTWQLYRKRIGKLKGEQTPIAGEP
ncbi:MAG: transporter [Bacteroidales bacterium]|nr:transporter [Bacteroidales bacterium]